MARRSICLALVLLVAALAAPQAADPSGSNPTRRLREANSAPRRLGICGWCAHGSRSWLGCECFDGWEGRCCDTRVELHEGKEFKLERIKNDEVEKELAFARTGSQLPPAAHGIFWMDQRGVNVVNAQATDPDYRQVGDTAADELLVSFGEAHWDPATRCAGPVPTFGGKKGHWTFMDQTGAGQNANWTTLYDNRLYLDFCFRSDEFDAIDLHVYVKQFGFWIRVPWFGMHLTMIKKPWGWDRQTTYIGGSEVLHYPVFQIVDGDGRRTEHYSAYLKWANNMLSSDHPDKALNKGEGTSLVGRLA